ncbi:MAG: YraN family protein [Deltaproteobacteria bacterium]|nr:YraN family protein [Deltaproteobacteria bacterium]
MTEQRLSLGRWGEQQAVRYLKRRLYRIIETNYRAPTGEIDIIARRGKMLAFVEVKTRSGIQCGEAVEAVNARKQRQIIRTAQWYLAKHGQSSLQPRFDVIAIQADETSHDLKHLKDAFSL